MNMITNTPSAMTINDISMPIFTGVVKPDWIQAAEAKGFSFVARVVDRLHFALKCQTCGALNKVKRFTLMASQPLCQSCITREWAEDAQAAGLEFLHRDEIDRHYGTFLASCGHELRRQFALIKRVVAGETGIRCETCHSETEIAEAAARGWELRGPDPQSDPNYRRYRHGDCGHEQRIARANMQSGRFGCGGCGVEWPAAPSYLYAMRFTLSNGRELVKLGFSRDPESRLRYQLQRDPAMPCSILREIAVPTGQDAIVIEKRLHAELRLTHSDCVVDPAAYRDQIRVKSEIYDARLTETILRRLCEVEAVLGHSAA
jgi:hypothetical protein